ncbi:PLP-dependent aminotransferase family protein [Brucella pituitosa]|uniref:PLP-dependent aminotransferase family protein n=1 Tax=Brucella pituitosa TaxID=571256 RepID=A0A643ET87_9HYPH|nr:PLP-dependent aminotransferase family protein [Brucella pituitosa]
MRTPELKRVQTSRQSQNSGRVASEVAICSRIALFGGKAARRPLLELPTDHQGVCPDDLRTCLSRHNVAACLFSSSYSNPMGATMPDDRKVKILDILAEHKVPLIEDDTYGDLVLRGSRPKPFTAFNSKAEVFYCSSFSKSVAPGYRIGWVRVKTRLDEIADRKFAASLCNAILPQVAMARFIETGAYARHVRKVLSALRNNLVRSRLQIASSFPASTKISDPAGGFVLWLELPPGFDSEELFQIALKKKICFAPGTIFSATDTYRNCLRISCGHHWDDSISSAILTLGGLATEQLLDVTTSGSIEKFPLKEIPKGA